MERVGAPPALSDHWDAFIDTDLLRDANAGAVMGRGSADIDGDVRLKNSSAGFQRDVGLGNCDINLIKSHKSRRETCEFFGGREPAGHRGQPGTGGWGA